LVSADYGYIPALYGYPAAADACSCADPALESCISGQAESPASSTEQGLEIMENNLFDRLVESMTQMEEIDRGERQPSREFHVDALQVRKIRQATGLSQASFAKRIDVAVGTLRNWEQGRREPEGPARALLKAIHNDPTHVLAALSGK
jgi:putative transcriptional regulator